MSSSRRPRKPREQWPIGPRMVSRRRRRLWARPRLEALGLIVAAGPQVLVSDMGAVSDSVFQPVDYQGRGNLVRRGGCLRRLGARSDPSKAVSRLDDDERGASIVRTPGGDQTLNVVNESGLYALVFTSRKPQARAFRRWVTGVVLPAIRHTGSFSLSRTDQASFPLPMSDDPTRRYIVIAAPGRPIHVRKTRPDAILDEKTSIDCEILCHNLKTIELWWQKVAQTFAVDRPGPERWLHCSDAVPFEHVLEDDASVACRDAS